VIEKYGIGILPEFSDGIAHKDNTFFALGRLSQDCIICSIFFEVSKIGGGLVGLAEGIGRNHKEGEKDQVSHGVRFFRKEKGCGYNRPSAKVGIGWRIKEGVKEEVELFFQNSACQAPILLASKYLVK
jgi:hypothetical protein